MTTIPWGEIAPPASIWRAREPIRDGAHRGVEPELPTNRCRRHPVDEDVEQDHRVLVVDAPDRPVDLQRQLVGDHRLARPAVDDVDVAGLGDEPALGAARSGLNLGPAGIDPGPGASRCQQLHHAVVLHRRPQVEVWVRW
jgi:hypothetical protein